MSINHLLRSPPELEIFAKKLTADEIDADKIVVPQLDTTTVVADDVYVRTNGGGPAYRLDQSNIPWLIDPTTCEWLPPSTVLPPQNAGAYVFNSPSFGIFSRSGNKATIQANFKVARNPPIAEGATGYNQIQFLIPQLEGVDVSSVTARFQMVSTSSNGYSYELFNSPYITGNNTQGGSPVYINLDTHWTKASGYAPAGTSTAPPGPEVYLVSVDISWLESVVNPPPPPLIEEEHIKPVVYVDGGVFKTVDENDEESEKTDEDEPETEPEVEPEVEHLVPDHVEPVVPEPAVTRVVKPTPAKKPRKGRKFRDSHAKYFPDK